MGDGANQEIRFIEPPARFVRVLNAGLRRILRTPLGRALPLALVEFPGRRSGRTYRLPVGWHRVDGGGVVVSQGTWPKNFIGGLEATVHHRGTAQRMLGTYVGDPEVVAATFRAIMAAGTSPRRLALEVPAGKDIEAADIARLGRAMIRFST